MVLRNGLLAQSTERGANNAKVVSSTILKKWNYGNNTTKQLSTLYFPSVRYCCSSNTTNSLI